MKNEQNEWHQSDAQMCAASRSHSSTPGEQHRYRCSLPPSFSHIQIPTYLLQPLLQALTLPDHPLRCNQILLRFVGTRRTKTQQPVSFLAEHTQLKH
jgi:hypothetical protein